MDVRSRLTDARLPDGFVIDTTVLVTQHTAKIPPSRRPETGTRKAAAGACAGIVVCERTTRRIGSRFRKPWPLTESIPKARGGCDPEVGSRKIEPCCEGPVPSVVNR